MSEPHLNKERDCYVCKQPFSKVHRYYDSMCEPCGEFNYAKREQTADLSGRYALVTGARVKIGYQASLKLLRAGAHVDRHDALSGRCRRPVFERAGFLVVPGRLQIHGLDLRHTPSVELFTRFLAERLPRLDYILNNACQTVRRPAGFFQHLLAREAEAVAALPAEMRGVLAGHDELRRRLEGSRAQTTRRCSRLSGSRPARGCCTAPRSRSVDIWMRITAAARPCSPRTARRRSAASRSAGDEQLAPAHARSRNARVAGSAARECHRAVHPQRPPEAAHGAHAGRHKHMVNVSAIEGQFYRATKTDKHAHTNMAKAALNMMTRTSAPDFVKDGIHMNAVDTGWITDEDPAVHAARKAEAGFSPPLDIIDGAARIVDPIFAGRLTGENVWGQFLKDYKPAPW